MHKMALKVFVMAVSLQVLLRTARAGVIPVESEDLHEGSVASSFTHFHGPVQAPEYEVQVPFVPKMDEQAHLHGQAHHDHGYTVDYVGHPKYEFSYGVQDQHTGDFHGQKETRDGKTVTGEYTIKEPGGTFRVVTYHADETGFHATVHTSGHNDHSGVGHGYHGHDQDQGQDQGHSQIQSEVAQEEEVQQEYSYPIEETLAHEGY